MRAQLHDPDAPDGLRLADVDEPVAGPGQILVAVEAASVNYLDAAYRDSNMPPGGVPGVDAAGTVVHAAADASGPPVGTRVVGFGSGTWAELAVLDVSTIAPVPDGCDPGSATALPAAGMTALQAVRALGPLIGRQVLVTGASGGVGRLAVQLAALAGADVTAMVGDPGRGAGLESLGARAVTTRIDDSAHFDAVLDNVGGPLLAEAFSRLAGGGLALSIGQASGLPTTLDLEAERRRGGRRRLEPFVVSPSSADLTILLDLLVRGRLDPQIGWRGSWLRAGEATRAVLSRSVLGKAVLDVGP